MTVSEIQKRILDETGLKTSVKKYSNGSMNGYLRIIPIFQNGTYPTMPFEFIKNLKEELSEFNYENKPLFCSVSDICIYNIEDDRIQMKKEKKTVIDTNKTSKGWGSKNSQMRLDKATARNAKKMRKGGTATYY